MFSTDLFTDSWLYQEGVAAGLAIAKAEAEAEGFASGIRHSLRILVNMRFPELGTLPEIDQIASPEVLLELVPAIASAQTADDFRSALQAAIHPN